ncbi:MAG: hypothetical protein M1815_000208 [Lichina confinis]|nr:MAG: hypothetical protein M1815_000208 [Lichina confinis]
MALRKEEEIVLSVFADVHYFFSPPGAKPLHHRFDKRSYVYVLHDPNQGQGRLEVANNAGTPDQDAVSGTLRAVQLEHSDGHPTLCTVLVGGAAHGAADASDTDRTDGGEWHLAAPDHRNEGKYLFKLHSIDIYFWAKEDAARFVEWSTRILSASQGKRADERKPLRIHQGSTSSVVQRLEHLAVSGSDVKHGSHSSGASQHQDVSPAAPGTAPPSGPHGTTSQPAEQPVDHTPMAYNPAAPAAPEPIKHREKTPPPVDVGDGTSLQYALAQDGGHPYPTAANQQAHGFPPPPPNLAHQPSFSGPRQQQPPYTSAGVTSSPYQNTQPSPSPSAGPYSPPPQQSSFSPFPSQVPGPPTTSPPQGTYGQLSPSTGPYNPTQGTPGSVAGPFTPPPNAAPYGAPPPAAPSFGHPGQPFPPHSVSPGAGQGASPYGSTSPPPPSHQPGIQDGGYSLAYASQPLQHQHQHQHQQPHQSYDQHQHQQPGYPGSVAPPVTQAPLGQHPYGGYQGFQQYGQPPTQQPPTQQQHQQQQQQQQQPGGIHQQAYVPSQADMAGDGGTMQRPQPPTSSTRLNDGAAKIEKGVGKFLKRLEKKIG